MSNPLNKSLAHNEDVSKDTAIEALHAFLDGELSVADQSDLFAHLAVCGDCRQELEGVMKFRRMSRTENLTVPPSLDAAMFKRLRKHKTMMTRIDRADDRRPLWNAKTAISLRTTVVTAMFLFLAGLFVPADTFETYPPSQTPVYQVEGQVTGTDELIQFSDMDVLPGTNYVYVFYPGIDVEALSADVRRPTIP
ncbi:MAG: anti-sigma factor [Bacteroidota bacterium]